MSRLLPRLVAFAALGLLSASTTFLGACSASSSDDGESADDELRKKKDAGADPSLDFQACDQQHVDKNADGDKIIICDKPFATPPFVRFPDDDTKSDVVTLYAAFDVSVGNFVTRDGTERVTMDDKGNAIAFQTHGAGLPSEMRMPCNRNMYTLYRITGKLGQAKQSWSKDTIPGIQVATGAPVVMVPGKIIDGSLVGAWEGTTNARRPDGTFAPDVVPIRVSFSNLVPVSNLKIWETGTSLPDGPVFKLTGTIENFDKSVKASDGTCYPALTSLGDKNPFHGATSGDVDTYRLGGMHFPGDQVLVFTVPKATSDWSVTAMGGLGPFGPSDWLATKGRSTLSLNPHGLPKGNKIEIKVVTGGGGGC